MAQKVKRPRIHKGTRVRLIKGDNAQSPPSGTIGIVQHFDAAGNIVIRWINGEENSISTLSRNLSGDTIEVEEYILTQKGRENCEIYASEMKAKQKEILDAKLDTCDETFIDYTPEDFLDELSGLFPMDDDGTLYNCFGVTDNYTMDYPLSLKLGEDFELRFSGGKEK